MNSRIITLTTDFGVDDFFVAAMKGVILSINPRVQIIDVTHSVPAHDTRSAAFTLSNCYHEFPAGTIHVAVVDPGVGSSRRAILVVTGRYYLVGPDNGVFSDIYAEESISSVITIEAEPYFHRPLSQTFHGRDIFAPVAAWLSKGVAPTSFGPPISDYVKFEVPHPERISPTHIRGHVVHIDRFGNLITNLTAKRLPPEFLAGATLIVNQREITRFHTHFAEAPPDQPFALFGSTGRLEIAVFQESAANRLNAEVGTLVELVLPENFAPAFPK
jgi:hypothetical protein